MSLSSWMKKFYPVEADEPMTERQAILHSIKKWSGLSPENLKKHRVRSDRSLVFDSIIGPRFVIAGETCALCHRYFGARTCRVNRSCRFCPLKKYLGHRCDRSGSSPYSTWIDTNDPKPMISALKGTLKNIKRKNGKKE